MSAQQLIERLRAARNGWCVLREADGDMPELAVCLRRPSEVELQGLRPVPGRDINDTLAEAACSSAVDWRGFTEAELLGAAIGSSDPLPFDAALWREVVRDRMEWLVKCTNHLMDVVREHLRLKAEQAKN